MLLTRRTNVLLDETDYLTLFMYSKENGKTMGEVIRDSLKKTIKTKKLSSKNYTDNDLIKRIKAGWKFLKNPEIPVDYKALVEYGRKY